MRYAMLYQHHQQRQPQQLFFRFKFFWPRNFQLFWSLTWTTFSSYYLIVEGMFELVHFSAFWLIEFQWLHLFTHFNVIVSFCQAEKDLQPWIAKDDGQKIWRINQRIVKLIVELMRNHDSPESLVILASASDLLLRATDGMLVDGEACTLPQLEVTYYVICFFLQWLYVLE